MLLLLLDFASKNSLYDIDEGSEQQQFDWIKRDEKVVSLYTSSLVFLMNVTLPVLNIDLHISVVVCGTEI